MCTLMGDDNCPQPELPGPVGCPWAFWGERFPIFPQWEGASSFSCKSSGHTQVAPRSEIK